MDYDFRYDQQQDDCVDEPQEWVEVLPSQFHHDHFEGPARVLRRRGTDVLVDLSGTAVWFHEQRIRDLGER